jgi:hypothetical protein
MFESQIIDGEAYIEMTQPQNAQYLKLRYRELQKAKEAQAEAMQAAQLQKAGGGGKVLPLKG